MAMKVRKSEKAEEKKPKKKKKGGIVGFLLFLVLILVLLLFFGDKFGLGLGAGLGGSGEGGGNEDDSVAAIATADPAESDVPEARGPAAIEISGDKIIFFDEAFTDYGAFEEYFYEAADKEIQYILRDNQAIKSVYDSAKALLDSFGVSYSEETIEG